MAGQLTPFRQLGDEARELLDISVHSAYDVFINKVAEARSMDVDRVDEIAQGRVWIGSDALELGLVDQLGGIDEAIASAAARAGLKEDAYGIFYVERELSFAERLLLQYARLLGLLLSVVDGGDAGLSGLLNRLGTHMNAGLATLDIWNDPRGIYYHCMCEVR